MKIPHLISFPSLFLALIFTAGCGKSEEKAVASQVAAKVNTTEITVYQLNSVLARTPNVTPATEHRVKREILDNLIDQQLAKQKAIENKLDRSPNVLQMLEAAKTEILARAYLEQISTAQTKPTEEEVKRYFDEHPDLFTQRRIYSIEEISLPVQPGIADALREQTAKLRSMQDIAAWLRSREIQFTANSGVRAAEQLPLDYIAIMRAMKDGETRVFELRGSVQVIRVVASKHVPVTQAAVAPKIRQFLFGQVSSAAVAREMKQVKEVAKIEYIGEFAVTPEEADAKAKALQESKIKTATDEKARQEADAAAREAAKIQAAAESLERADAVAKARAQAEQDRRAAEAKAPVSGTAQAPMENLQKGARGL